MGLSAVPLPKSRRRMDPGSQPDDDACATGAESPNSRRATAAAAHNSDEESVVPLLFPPFSQSSVAAARPVIEAESTGRGVTAALADGPGGDARRAAGDGPVIVAGADCDAPRRPRARSALPDADVVGNAGIWSAVGEGIDGAAVRCWVAPARADWVHWAGWA